MGVCFFDRYPSNTQVAARQFADYLRKTSWKFGACENDLVIVVSKNGSDVRVGVTGLLG